LYVSELLRADPVLGRHLFCTDPNRSIQPWQRRDGLATSLRDAFVAVEPWLRFENLVVTLGTIDENGAIESGDVACPASLARWPRATAVAAAGVVGAIRIGLPVTAQLGRTTQFACDSGFLRQARVLPAAPLDKLSTAWIEGSADMEVRVRGHLNSQVRIELQLGTSLYGVPDQRDPEMVVEGAPLSAWRAASRPVLAAIGQALAATGFVPAL
jgi:hypothetical protein